MKYIIIDNRMSHLVNFNRFNIQKKDTLYIDQKYHTSNTEYL